ncbi:MAG TPA: arsenate reductase ArsC [Gaiellaceae bacterium]|nr:arsenate reductase ArsC [Gaiellaceae bacterium]
MNVLFVCVGNQGRSVMAERLFERAAQGEHAARSAGVVPGDGPHPEVVEALREVGIDAGDHVPHRLDDADLGWADVAVSVCADDQCPATPGLRRLNWGIQDPAGLPLEEVRPIRDEIERRVEQLTRELQSEA